MDLVDRIALDRVGVLSAPAGPTTATTAAATLAELARVGVRVTNASAVTDGLACRVKDVVEHVRHQRGGRGTFTPLFAGFPDALPSFDDVDLRALLGMSRLPDLEDFTPADVAAAFDFTDLGWWPASSVHQDVPVTLSARQVQQTLRPDGSVQWQDVTVVDEAARDAMVRDWMARTFASAASVRADVLDDLRLAVGVFGVGHVDASTVRFRELRALLTRAAWDHARNDLPSMGLTPDDLLRLFADLTDGDVSLASKVRFPKLSRSARRVVVATLEASDRLDDVFRRRSLWLAIARGLHVQDFPAPRTTETFARLSAGKHNPASLASQVERLLPVDYPAAIALVSQSAPGTMIRSLRRLASLACANPSNIAALTRAVDLTGAQVPVRVLLGARSQLVDNGTTYPRVAFAKGGAALRIDRTPGHLALAGDHVRDLVNALDRAVTSQLSARASWEGKTVYVDPAAADILIPDTLRSTSAGLIEVERGTRVPVGRGESVRLFVHWKEPVGDRTDLDLSALTFDEDMNVVGDVSYMNLRSGALVHSGDITSAPVGAQEFIDIDMPAARRLAAQGQWRYVAPVVQRYWGPTFDELPEAVTGWMLRENTSSIFATFDPATVSNAFALTGQRRTAVPFLLDVVTGQLVYVDSALGGAVGANVRRDGSSISEIVKMLAARRNIKANVEDLVHANVHARGATLTTDERTADITVGPGPQYTYDVLRPAALLADLL